MTPDNVPPRTSPQILRALVRAAFIGIGAIALSIVGGIVLGLIAEKTGVVRGETAAWAPLIGFFYGLVAGLVLGPVFAWKVIASRLGISRKANLTTATALLLVLSLTVFFLMRSPRMTGPSPSASRVSIDSLGNDGHTVIFTVEQNDTSVLYKADTSTGHASRLMQADDFEESAELSPDGKQIVFVSRQHQDDSPRLMLCDADGNHVHALLPESHSEFAPHFSRDGKLIYFAHPTSRDHNGTPFEIEVVNADGSGLKQLTHRNFGAENEVFGIFPQSFSADGTRLLMRLDSSAGSKLMIDSLTNNDLPPTNIVPRIPNSPPEQQIENAFFTPDDKGIIFMAASQGAKNYDYDVYRLELATGYTEKLTATRSYASDFRISPNGETAAFFIWSLSAFNSVPIDPSLRLLNTRTHAITNVNITGLP